MEGIEVGRGRSKSTNMWLDEAINEGIKEKTVRRWIAGSMDRWQDWMGCKPRL